MCDIFSSNFFFLQLTNIANIYSQDIFSWVLCAVYSKKKTSKNREIVWKSKYLMKFNVSDLCVL